MVILKNFSSNGKALLLYLFQIIMIILLYIFNYHKGNTIELAFLYYF